MFRYAQREEKGAQGKWLAVPADKKIDERVQEMGAVRWTILAVSQDLTEEGVDLEDVKYLGPLYFDIDTKHLEDSIEPAQDLVHKLIALEVDPNDIEIYCSGSKGFHVIVPYQCFTKSNRAVKNLPWIYMEMARDLYVPGVDFQVYSRGKGRMFRPPNGPRPDGKFRVRIDLSQLASMTVAQYHHYVSKPRLKPFDPAPLHLAAPLQAIYERCKIRVKNTRARPKASIQDEELKPMAEDPPDCVMELVNWTKEFPNFNQVALQVATFISRSGTSTTIADGLVKRLAQSGESTSYPTPKDREAHVNGLISYCDQKPTVAFSCGVMRSLVGRQPCANCPLEERVAAAATTEVLEADMGIESAVDGYYALQKEGSRKVSTFTLEPTEVFLDQAEDGYGEPRRIGTTMNVLAQGRRVGTGIYFDETGWRSRTEFIKQFEGVNGMSFLGTDNDLQKIKHILYSGEAADEIDEIINVYAAGVHTIDTGKRKIYTYVEPGMSINSYGIADTHKLQGKCVPAPRLRQAKPVEKGDQAVKQALDSMLESWDPLTTAHLLGWHCLCHLKVQMVDAFEQFPVLNLWGRAGSGKSKTATLFVTLNGMAAYKPVACGMTTSWPVYEVVTTTTTIPRVLEEFNEHRIPRKTTWMDLVEIVKGAWDGYPVTRGTISKSKANGRGRTGAETTQMVITSPLLLVSEEASDISALRQRTLQLQLTTDGRAGRSEAYYDALAKRDDILRFARVLTMSALKVKQEWVARVQNANLEEVSPGLGDRPRYGYAGLLTGLYFFSEVTKSLGYDFSEKLAVLREALLGHVNKDRHAEIKREKEWSTVDVFTSILLQMLRMSVEDPEHTLLVPGRHWSLTPDRGGFPFDMGIVHMLYKQFCVRMQEPLVFKSIQQLMPLLKDESYFESAAALVPTLHKSRKFCVLNIYKMEDKGHDISVFDVD